VFGPALYSHLLKLALQGEGSGIARLWVPELNLPIGELLPASYVQSDVVRLEMYARTARCQDHGELEELEHESFRRFGRPPPAADDFFAMARLRIECRERGITELDVGPDAIAATLLADRSQKSRSRLLQRSGDRVLFADKSGEHPLRRVEAFLDLLDA
jgi:transcription-repair coupling factor (superfamily II helicase)